MATRCESEYNLATDETVVGLRCVHDTGHEFDHLFMVRWESADPVKGDAKLLQNQAGIAGTEKHENRE